MGAASPVIFVEFPVARRGNGRLTGAADYMDKKEQPVDREIVGSPVNEVARLEKISC